MEAAAFLSDHLTGLVGVGTSRLLLNIGRLAVRIGNLLHLDGLVGLDVGRLRIAVSNGLLHIDRLSMSRLSDNHSLTRNALVRVTGSSGGSAAAADNDDDSDDSNDCQFRKRMVMR